MQNVYIKILASFLPLIALIITPSILVQTKGETLTNPENIGSNIGVAILGFLSIVTIIAIWML